MEDSGFMADVLSLDLAGDLGYSLEQVSHQAEVGNLENTRMKVSKPDRIATMYLEDWGLSVLVDGDNNLGVLHTWSYKL